MSRSTSESRTMIQPPGHIDDTPTTIIFTTSLEDKDAHFSLADDFNFEACMRKLSLKDQNKVNNSRHNRRRTLLLHLFTKVVLNYALFVAGEVKEWSPFKELPLTHNEYGKPVLRLAKDKHVQFNSSSSNDLAAIVVQFNETTPIGIDLSHERQDSISSAEFMDQFNGIFAPNEVSQLEAVPDLHKRYVFFNQLWTLKEAFTKFVGCGLNVDLSSFSFDVQAPVHFQPPSETLQWESNISVDYKNLEPKFRSIIGDLPVTCCSAILRHSTPLPVIVSIVTQSSTVGLKSQFIDMNDVIEDIIKE